MGFNSSMDENLRENKKYHKPNHYIRSNGFGSC